MNANTYEAVTKIAEERIALLMEQARAEKDNGERNTIPDKWAFGVFLLWENITHGWRKEGDSERLENLLYGKPPQ